MFSFQGNVVPKTQAAEQWLLLFHEHDIWPGVCSFSEQ